MTTNNFNKSSTGTDLEFSGMYDCQKSRDDFENNFKVIQSSNRGSSIVYFINEGNLKDDTSIEFSLKGKREAFVSYLLEHTYLTKSELKKLSKHELVSEVENIMGSFEVATYETENKDLDDYGFQIVPDKELVWTSSRGYSQGDYVDIVYCPKDIIECWGVDEIDEKSLRETFDNLCWDAPVRATITVNGDEYNYWDAPDAKDYEWSRDEFIAYVVKETKIDVQLLKDLVPLELDYSN